MNRRDVILVSVLLNAGLLAVLFLTAVKSDPDLPSPSGAVQTVLLPKEEESLVLAEASAPQEIMLQPVDEVDHVLREYLPEVPIETSAIELPPEPVKQTVPDAVQMVEVTVKRGDALEKIARANHTTIDAIKKANGLANDKLKIGQVLKIPVGTKPVKAIETSAAIKSAPIEVASEDPVYYTIKSGDNPWKIAKQFHVKFEDLLKMNQLDEDSGRNLKVGDKIRVK